MGGGPAPAAGRGLHPRRLVLVGHSAMIAAVAAAQEPDRFSRLVLVAPSPCYVDDPGTDYVGGFTREDVDEVIESLASNYFAWAAAMAPW